MREFVVKDRRILFPLELIKPEWKLTEEAYSSSKMILSKFNVISHEQILHLEKSGVYSIEEFFDLTTNNLKELGIGLKEFELIKLGLKNQIEGRPKLPKKIVSLSENFGVIGVEKSEKRITLGIYWKGLLTLLSSSKVNLLGLKQSYNRLLEDLNHPDLITYEIEGLSTWISEDSHYSYYFQDPLDIDFNMVKIRDSKLVGIIPEKEFQALSRKILCTAYLLQMKEISKNEKSHQLESPLELVLGTGNLESPH